LKPYSISLEEDLFLYHKFIKKIKFLIRMKQRLFLLKLFALIILVILPFMANAQVPPLRKITGVVTDATTGESLPGVNIKVSGMNRGVVSDNHGNFSIELPPNSVLDFSYIGYTNEKVNVGRQSQLNVKLSQNLQDLGEVVVVGYGTQKKATLTGSVANVSGEEIEKVPAANLTSSLAGRLPGLTINQRSGEPGRDDPSILIRGISTTGDTSPLIIIDGVERSYLSRMNPEDIESYTVLKDASAAIYGARAANGVILITTKKGKEGKAVFSFSSNTALQSPTQVQKLLDASTYATVYNEGAWYRAGRPTSGYTQYYSDEAIQKYKDGSDPISYPNTDWEKAVLKKHSTQTRTSIQATGGTKDVHYLFSGSYTNQDGNYKHNPTYNKQYSMRSNVEAKLNENLTVGVNISAIFTDKKYSSVSTWTNFYNIVSAPPTLIALYPNGLPGPGRLGENPLVLDQRGYDRTRETPINSTFTATYKIPHVQGLKIDGSFNYDLNNTFEKVFNQPYSYYEYDASTGEYIKKAGTGQTTIELTDTYYKYTTMLYNFKLVYDRTFGMHHVGAMVGQEQQTNTTSYAMAYRKNFLSSAIQEINTGSTSSDDKNNGGSSSSTARNNFFGRFNYDFGSKYLTEFIFRYDGSQNFPVGHRYGFFPAASVGWRISEEPFFHDAAPYVDQLKLRFSYGQTGNDKVSSYQYLQTYSFGNNYVFGASDASGIYSNTMPNTNITWERDTKANIALDASLWKGLLGIQLDVFKDWRTKILQARNVTYPNTLGFSSLPDENIGKVNNQGFELVVSHRNKVGDLTYSLEGNMSFAVNKIIYEDEVPATENYANATGHPVNASLYYKADGIFHTQEQLDAYPHASGTQVGDIKVLDLNGDGVINSDDQFRFNYTDTPQIVFGFNTSFQYKSFDLSLFFQGQTKVYHDDGTFDSLGSSSGDNGYVARAKNRWTVDNPNGTMPRADGYTPGSTTFFLYDATFIRLKSAEFSYMFPKKLISKVGLSELRLYVSGSNLLTWAKEITFEDPEQNGDSRVYPQQRVINLGVNLKF
jgi:TonB-linked SusC/RagA family outer membrane protein